MRRDNSNAYGPMACSWAVMVYAEVVGQPLWYVLAVMFGLIALLNLRSD